MKRRTFLRDVGAAGLTACMIKSTSAKAPAFKFRYAVPSAMYGDFTIDTVLGEVKKTGAEHIDLWPAPHANQREQVRDMGDDAFVELLNKHEVKLGISTCYKLGPFALADEMRWASRIAGEGVTLVCGARGKKNLKGAALKKEVQAFVEKMKPQIAVAAETDCTIAIENHKNSLIVSPDSMRFFAEATADIPQLGLSFAPHHLPQDGAMQGQLVRELGGCIKHFYAQQYGNGSHHEQPWETEKLQMPGLGALDFGPMVKSLAAIKFNGFTEIFMHPYPRGKPILETADAITAEINRSRTYLEGLLS